MYITKILNLSIIGSILLTFGILSNPTISFSQQESSSVIITLGAADEGNFEPFTPRALNVMPGSMVSWINEDATPHTVTAEGTGAPLFDSGPISPGDTFDNIFDMAGEFGYHCSIHPWMTGRVMVG
ncbi:MAG TPA: plastocyanin/azurin family copper-binding protein [Nitrososphaeraceae archaeon]|jgi:plastocyanin